ncbi:MAG: sugar phosphate isomerase/epimerase [Dehalococcoidia bacterium]|nr:sugar phosphate isomerase/epimerase [Dehalococcoidia bacterium]
MLTPADLVLCLGAVQTAPFAERVRAARASGFAGISMWMSHYDEARAEGLSHADMRALLDDAGVVLAMLEYITAWANGPGDRDAIVEETARICGIAEELGADTVLAVTMEPATDLAAAAEGLAIACDVAARHGQQLGVEFLPWTGIPSLAAAWPIVRDADRPNAGLVLDAWHWFRSGPDPDLLRAIPGEKVIHLQISDAPAQPAPDVVAETIGHRLLPGHGDVDLAGLLRILDETGRRGPTAVEVFSDWLRGHPIDEGARRAAEAARAVLAASR